MSVAQLTTGLAGLDRALRGLIPGDNIVWRVDSVAEYRPFVQAYAQNAIKAGETLIYFRFAKHEHLVPDHPTVQVHELHPEDGFEKFITQIHKVIERTGPGGYYVFDCLSDLAVDWFSDNMLGNFFMLTCPYLYDMQAIAYFAVLADHHAAHAIASIANTTQILIDVYHHRDHLYIHPIKVQQRYSSTMYMLHEWRGDEFIPITESCTIAEIMTATPWSGSESVRSSLGLWSRAFQQAQKFMDPLYRQERPPEQADELLLPLLRMLVTRDDRVLALARKYLTLSDVLDIQKRMVGTGLIGGKSVGMILGRAILEHADKRWKELLEPHDSFYIGSDVFYSYLVRNGCWWIREKQKDLATFLEGAEVARQRLLTGTFPEYMLKEFSDMLDYFGQSPMIVRSSSLLEDNFGNSFAGKYESVFCANQGSRDKRMEDFLSAIRTIYASTMSEVALRYRAQKGILDRDEQMSILVQRVSGALYGNLFFPQAAGVGLSFNPYVWNEEIDPKAGMLRLVFGLGTRAVDRSDDDYTRVVALNAPRRRPESNIDEVRRYTQRRIDSLDLTANRLISSDFEDVVGQSPVLPIDLFASRDESVEQVGAGTNRPSVFPWVLTFEKLLEDTPFVKDMHEMLATLEKGYSCPVDTEFTANFFGHNAYKINLVQCRPLTVTGGGTVADVPLDIDKRNLILEARGAVIGHSRQDTFDRLVYVVPSVYGKLPLSDRYSIARLIGKIMHVRGTGPRKNTMILGPGRWGTTTPSLGIPVSFAEINTVSAVCEIVAMREDLVPDVSLGTHFFNELVEMDILYLALFPDREGNFLNEAFFDKAPNRLADMIPEAAGRANVIRVIDAADLGPGTVIRLNANTLKQRVVCYLQRE